VRFSVAVENYNYQHQDLRTENGVEYGDTIDKMDFPYLARVTKLNAAALAWLASAPPPPETRVEGAVSTDTTVAWDPIVGASGYMIYRRPTDSSRWERVRAVGASAGVEGDACPRLSPSKASELRLSCGLELKGVRVDDWVFGVSSVSKDGFESPVASAVPGGAFKPYVKPAEVAK
jgi:hypothetical protein